MRFKGVTPDAFRAIVEGLAAAGPAGALPDGLTSVEFQGVVGTIETLSEGGRSGPVGIAVYRYVGGTRISGILHGSKKRLAHADVPRPGGLSYRLSLARERSGIPADEAIPATDDSMTRIKLRASWLVTSARSGAAFRADLTAVRQLEAGETGGIRSAAQALLVPATKPKAKKAKPFSTPKEFLAHLESGDHFTETSLTRLEVELEHVPTETSDVQALVDAGVDEIDSLADAFLSLVDPGHADKTAYQSEIAFAAEFIVSDPGRRRPFRDRWGLKRLLPGVTTLTRVNYGPVYFGPEGDKSPPGPAGYFASPKADGVRALAVARNGRLSLLADRLRTFKPAAISNELASVSIVDGELVFEDGGYGDGDGAGSSAGFTFHVFDVIALKGENFAKKGYEDRVVHCEAAAVHLSEFGLPSVAKPVIHLTGTTPEALEAQFRTPELQLFPEEDGGAGDGDGALAPLPVDGVILTAPGLPYEDKSAALKYKPETTIDFLVKVAPPSAASIALGAAGAAAAAKAGATVCFLFVGVSDKLFRKLGLVKLEAYNELFSGVRLKPDYFPIQFAPALAPSAYIYLHPADGGRYGDGPIDGRVVEFRVGGNEGPMVDPETGLVAWEALRDRSTDRRRALAAGDYFGNDRYVAEDNFLNAFDPLTPFELWAGPTAGYFADGARATGDSFEGVRKMTNWAKEMEIKERLSQSAVVVDLAGGRGSDLGRFRRVGVRRLVVVEKDRSAATTYARRHLDTARRAGKRAPGSRKGKAILGRREGALKLAVVVQDLNGEGAETGRSLAAEIAARVPSLMGGGATGAVCNLAIHYFLASAKSRDHFLALAAHFLAPGAPLLITAMDGGVIHDAFVRAGVNAPGDEWRPGHDPAAGDGAAPPKYIFRRLYGGKKLAPVGQAIELTLPFSRGEFYQEFLVNVDALVKAAAKFRLELVSRRPFPELLPLFRVEHPDIASSLTPADLEYLGCFTTLAFERLPDPKTGGGRSRRRR